MPQHHGEQFGTFHITTNANKKMSWCTLKGVPELLIDNLRMTIYQHEAALFAFCILPDHMHIVVNIGKRGVSKFLQSFKQNSSRDIRIILNDIKPRSADSRVRTTEGNATNILAKESSAIKFSGWQRGFHDELIRDNKQLEHAINYVQYNAAKHELVDDANDWPWTSLHYQNMIEESHLQCA